MDKPPRAKAKFNCACGKVTYEAIGTPITSLTCYCDDCQEGARQIQSLPLAAAVQEPDGGTEYLAYRKDRVSCLSGASLLKHHKIREDSPTNRVIAVCCNSAMLITFVDRKHWVDLYRSRCEDKAWPVQMRICTRFRLDGRTLPTDVPAYSRYPFSLIRKLVLARIAMLFRR